MPWSHGGGWRGEGNFHPTSEFVLFALSKPFVPVKPRLARDQSARTLFKLGALNPLVWGRVATLSEPRSAKAVWAPSAGGGDR